MKDFGLRSEAFLDMDKFIIKTECFNSEKKLFRSTSYAISSIHDRLLSGFITDVQAAIAACDDYNEPRKLASAAEKYEQTTTLLVILAHTKRNTFIDAWRVRTSVVLPPKRGKHGEMAGTGL